MRQPSWPSSRSSSSWPLGRGAVDVTLLRSPPKSVPKTNSRDLVDSRTGATRGDVLFVQNMCRNTVFFYVFLAETSPRPRFWSQCLLQCFLLMQNIDKNINNTRCCTVFLLKPHKNLSSELLCGFNCSDQADNGLEGIPEYPKKGSPLPSPPSSQCLMCDPARRRRKNRMTPKLGT